jgi:predicted Co/Zn/Cd cation transporter (cation efflux family)
MNHDPAKRASRPAEAVRGVEPMAEQRALKLSIAVTLLTGLAGILGGLAIDSRAITFDGMYSFVDVLLTFGVLAVAKLLMQEPSRRFHLRR